MSHDAGTPVYRDAEWEFGMLCEGCDKPFQDGDEIHLNFVAMLPDGTPIMGDSCCPRCFEGRVPEWPKGAAC